MPSIHKTIQQIKTIEDLTHKNTPVHNTAPVVKLLLTFLYILNVVSFPRQSIGGLLVFACFPVFIMIIGELPLKPLLSRCLIALPFAFLAGISNLLLDRQVILLIGKIYITSGMVSFTSLLLKTLLTVMAVLILAATTGINELQSALISLHFPSVIIVQIMMTYRYMGVLLQEASLMYQAYILRAPNEKGIKLPDIGSFLGQLILRSMDRAERIYHAMQCRGFEGNIIMIKKKSIGTKGWMTMIVMAFVMILLRVFDLGLLVEKLILS